MALPSRRTALVSFLACIELAIVVIALLSIATATAAVQRNAREGARASAGASRVAVQQRLQGVFDTVESTARKLPVTLVVDTAHPAPGDARDAQALLSALAGQPGFARALITDGDGRLISSSSTPKAGITDLSGEDWFRRRTFQPTLGAIGAVGGLDSDHSAPVISPIRDTATQTVVRGYLVAVYDLGAIQEFVDKVAGFDNLYLTLIDPANVVAARPAARHGWTTDINQDLVRQAQSGRSGLIDRQAGLGPVFSAYLPILPTNWVMVADMPAAQAFAEVESLKRTVIAIAAVISVMLLVAMVVGMRMVQHAQQAEALRDRLESLNSLDEATRAVHSRRGEEALHRVVQAARSLARADLAVLWQESGETGMFVDGEEVGPGLIGEMCAALGPIPECGARRLGDLGSLNLRGWDGYGPLVAFALNSDQGPIGRLVLVRRFTDEPFSDEEEALLRQLARHAGTVIEKARQDQELEEANVELERTSRLKSEFLANMSHELRTPLSAIIGFSELLIDGTDGALNQDQMEDISQIQRSGRSLLGLINDILDLSKIEAGRMVLEFERVDIGSTVKGVIGSLRPLAQARSLELEPELPDQVPAVRADEMRVRQILTNLVSNALKFTRKGGVYVRCRVLDETVEMSVVDTGIGIPADARERIFEAFTQADGSTTRNFGGTGLGLSITRRLIQMQGGEIGVESTEGSGSRFWFTLPRDIREAPRVHRDRHPAGDRAFPQAAFGRRSGGL